MTESAHPGTPPDPGVPAPVASVGPAAPACKPDRDIFGNTPVAHPDWSHRRGEPRVLALIWMIYLMGVTAIMFMTVSDALFVSSAITRPAARAMILATAAGIALLWPAIRLAQQPPENPVRDVFRDLFVLLIPAQAVIWPHALRVLANWPLPVLLGIAATLGAWALVVGGVLAMANSGRAAGRVRWAWMLVVLVVVFGSPLLGVALGIVGPTRVDQPRPGWMLSPLTSVLEIARDRDAAGTTNPVSITHWRAIAAVGCVGGALLCLAGASGVATTRRVA